MPENTEEKTVDWQMIYDFERNRIPARELCPGVQRHFQWEASNPLHKVPIKWLENYASAFYFTDEELLAARSTDELPLATGVYFLFDGDSCIYLGQTNNFARRLEQHIDRGLWWDAHVYFEVPPFFILAVEAYYIRRIKPVHNHTYPPLSVYCDIVKKLGLDRK